MDLDPKYLPDPDDPPSLAASLYVSMGWRPLPLWSVDPRTGACECSRGVRCGGSAGKHPRMRAWQDLRPTREDVLAWWKKWPDAGVGLAMGGEARLVALDIDGPAGRESLRALEAIHGPLPRTLASRSGRVDGGEHRVFVVPRHFDMSAIRNNAGKLATGLDVRGDGGQIATCPTVHRTGSVYTWIDRVPVAELPRWLFERMASASTRAAAPARTEASVTPEAPSFGEDHARYARAALNQAIEVVERAPKGYRNDTLNREAYSLGGLVARGLLSASEVEDALYGAMLNGRWDPEAIKAQHLRTLRRALEDGCAAPRTVPPRSSHGRSVSDSLQNGRSREAGRGAESVVDDDDIERAAIMAEGKQAPTRSDVGRAPSPPPAASPRRDGTDRAPRALPALRAGTGECTELANAEGLVAVHGADLRFVAELGGWYHYDGRRWSRDSPAAERAAKDYTRLLSLVAAERLAAARRALDAVAESSDETAIKRARAALDGAQRRYAWAMRSQGARALSNMLALASSEPGVVVPASAFDADPWSLCCLNGVVDLRTGKLRPHRREDLITRLAPVVYDPAARSELWETFLHDVTGGDRELAGFLGRAVGYSMSADTSEEKLFFVHGPAASGKSTFLEAVKATLGDYGTTSDFETFLVRPLVGAPRNDIARLAGSRFVVSIEVDDGKRLAEALVKSITGGDTVTARMLYQESFEFKPTFKLWLAANHAPRVSDEDLAMWRRILRIPFDSVIPKERRDRRVKRTLTDVRKSGAAILAWAVRGCLAWQKDGLAVPASVEAATETYRQENNPLREFLDDECVVAKDRTVWPDVWVTRSALREAYERWGKENGARHLLGPKAFTRHLRELGCNDKAKRWVDNASVRAWEGIRLRQAADDAMDEVGHA
ncbi:phage/plasmid primase, P4 family [Polyangium sorediatum]|uniref:Phage/plasmid primase, P4 family n=1 Tax=Polyangium sorediatum TaxID=889274 RepID=A0ABT6PAC7_9BACT|nr:phage/plasmid primase, P4 family [Polyangium sorediatum]MDI1437469.1 phage/plasmid primase, P4 family [Polyangium sorediatum]